MKSARKSVVTDDNSEPKEFYIKHRNDYLSLRTFTIKAVVSINKNKLTTFDRDNDLIIDSRPYIGWKHYCEVNTNSTNSTQFKLINFVTRYQMIFESSNKIMVASVFFGGLILFVLIFFLPTSNARQKESNQYFYIFLFNLLFMIITVNALLSILSESWAILYNSSHEREFEDCSDFNTNSKLFQIKKLLGLCLVSYTIVFFLQFVNWSLPLLLLLFRNIKHQEFKNDNLENQPKLM